MTTQATALVIAETLQVNAIVWIRSLPENELGPTRRVLEDLEPLARSHGWALIEFTVENRIELAAALDEIASMAAAGLRPILHLDAHGNPDRGILLAPTGEYAPWSDVISDLRAINISTGNNLVCIFGLCFGLHLYKFVSLSAATPAYLFFAPEYKISVGELEAQTVAFYRAVQQTGNVTQAFEQTLASAMKSFHCQGLFLEALAFYVRNHARGKIKTQRQEQLVTSLLRVNGLEEPTAKQLATARARVKALVKPGQHLIDRFASTFLVGRSAAFNYEHVERMSRRFSR